MSCHFDFGENLKKKKKTIQTNKQTNQQTNKQEYFLKENFQWNLVQYRRS